MRFNLYKVEIIGETGKSVGHVVAPSTEQATAFLKEHHDAIGLRLTKTTICRVDEMLGSDQWLGLDDMLEGAPVGFACYCNIAGWIAHRPAPSRLSFFRIEDQHGTQRFVVAPGPNMASAIYFHDTPIEEGGRRALRLNGFS